MYSVSKYKSQSDSTIKDAVIITLANACAHATTCTYHVLWTDRYAAIMDSDLSEVGVVLACLQPQPLPQLRTGTRQQVVEHMVVPGEVKGQRSPHKGHKGMT